MEMREADLPVDGRNALNRFHKQILCQRNNSLHFPVNMIVNIPETAVLVLEDPENRTKIPRHFAAQTVPLVALSHKTLRPQGGLIKVLIPYDIGQ